MQNADLDDPYVWLSESVSGETQGRPGKAAARWNLTRFGCECAQAVQARHIGHYPTSQDGAGVPRWPSKVGGDAENVESCTNVHCRPDPAETLSKCAWHLG